jgi:hypothetical protein
LTAKAFAELEALPRAAGALSWWHHQLAAQDKVAAPTVEDSPLRLIRLQPAMMSVVPRKRGYPVGSAADRRIPSPGREVREVAAAS